MADLKDTPATLQIPAGEADGQERNGGEAVNGQNRDDSTFVMEINGVRIYEAMEHRPLLFADTLIDMETFLDFSFETGRDLELINGVMMERAVARGATLYTPLNGTEWRREAGNEKTGEGKNEGMAAQLTHEKLFAWLMVVLSGYAEQCGSGLVLGSRTPIALSGYKGRMPDLLFVRQSRIGIVQEKNIAGPPDLVIELVSPNDRPGELRQLQADYRLLGVEEIVFVNMLSQEVRVTRLQGTRYIEETFVTGEWRCQTLLGLNLQVEWLLREPRPPMLTTLQTLLDNAADGA